MPESLPHGLRPIADAPVKRGEVYGPCLLVVGEHWTTGEYEGSGWWDFGEDEGWIEPRYFLFLGKAPS